MGVALRSDAPPAGRIFARIIAENGSKAAAKLRREHVVAGRDRRISTPAAANNFLKTLRGLCRWAADNGLIEADPTIGVRAMPLKGSGFHVWSDEEIAAFEAHWPIGTRERLAFAILLYTGLRRGDAASSADSILRTVSAICVRKRRERRWPSSAAGSGEHHRSKPDRGPRLDRAVRRAAYDKRGFRELVSRHL